MENHRANLELDIKEIIRAAKEAATTHSKDWILKQIRGLGAVEGQTQEEHGCDRPSSAAKNDEPSSKVKKHQRNASRGVKKGDKRDAGELPEVVVPGPSKRAKANNDEQISMIVQECLKSTAPLLFANPGGVRETKGSRGTESNGDTATSDTRGKGSQGNRAEAPCARCPSPEKGEEEAASTSAMASPTQVWGTDSDKNARRRHSPLADSLAPEAYKRGSLGRPYMVARAPGLACMITLAVKYGVGNLSTYSRY
ncbi:hypothetical protein NDU88_002269 [Pleurodeles waltl]|uniref:Uncharacterized protein n=1 Tax=Pleurodeles waltl TaxID=8319 RepID=A0AAV7P8Y1_PLEWA|nr:hypothetical protein NDU88_002269 [Pleurodeles waltl]